MIFGSPLSDVFVRGHIHGRKCKGKCIFCDPDLITLEPLGDV